ncbi:hypothetical protein LX16_2923 [Stackebrandtia albiflava]|uniref:Uncharacterized protein n=1 Tax=Stackebrandtia albiflava TaxID=406432 RepID=A0A562V2T0_9ACTN|nr:hypothetical protein [Stackebrandtia albiflava]TWJ12168.1 hypothetical protein LX16_2923 [Stackebrandtia albiflava]
MTISLRRVLASTATAGVLGAALTGCSLFGGASLTCEDLKAQFDSYGYAADADLGSVDQADIEDLGAWMVDNGPSFEDKELGTAVTTAGEMLPPMIEAFKSGDQEAMAALGTDTSSFDTIDAKCGDVL